MEKCEELYKGKVKFVYIMDDLDVLVLFFRNDMLVFDGKKIEQFDCKGMVNNKFNVFIMEKLEVVGIEIYFIKLLSDQELLVKSFKMMFLECVVRNIFVGSICWRFGVEEGLDFNLLIFEFFFKNDDFGDLMVNEYYIKSFGWVEKEYVEKMQELIFQVNIVLKQLFLEGGMLLVDYKFEFGLYQGCVVLGDEFIFDGCCLWDKEICKKLDKDCFCQGFGGVVESYEEVGVCLGMKFD